MIQSTAQDQKQTNTWEHKCGCIMRRAKEQSRRWEIDTYCKIHFPKAYKN